MMHLHLVLHYSMWLGKNGSKRWGEMFFLLYSPFWIALIIGIIVPFSLYEDFKELEYLMVGLVSALPALLLPLFFVGKVDTSLFFKDRYWVKANLWLMIFTYVGNYFWTHYFFKVLGASYTFPSWKMNGVPHATYLLAHVCFLFYHVLSNITLRKLRFLIEDLPVKIQWILESTWILSFGYFMAFLETMAISKFPYYDFVDRASMYKVGCLFYAVIFVVSFPMFSRIDEKVGDRWNLARVAIDALAAAMLVTILLDLWRLYLGPIVPFTVSNNQCILSAIPWLDEKA